MQRFQEDLVRTNIQDRHENNRDSHQIICDRILDLLKRQQPLLPFDGSMPLGRCRIEILSSGQLYRVESGSQVIAQVAGMTILTILDRMVGRSSLAMCFVVSSFYLRNVVQEGFDRLLDLDLVIL